MRKPTGRTKRCFSKAVAAATAAQLVLLQVAALPAHAGDLTDGLLQPKDVVGKGSGSEYVSGDLSHPVLMQINLWGGVNKPGIHYVPVHTDLITLLSFAGGPSETARIDDVVIKRKVSTPATEGVAAGAGASATAITKEELVHVNLEDYVNGRGGAMPALQANDIVMIPVSKPWISNNASTLVAITSGVVTIVITGLLIQQQLKSH